MRRAIRFFLIYFVAFSGLISAAIDSGGGVASLGSGTNHSSIGGGFDTSASTMGLIEILYPEIPAGSDADGNGLPDAWETQHFGVTGSSATADADSDGTTNLMEYLAGTDPRSGTSVFRPTSRVESGKLILTVPTVSGRNYRVWGTANLQTAWTAHETITGDGSNVEWLYALSQSPKYFLKIEILIPTN